MSKVSVPRPLLVAFLATALVGSALHFLFSALPNPLTALISPINESIWEHLKLIYWPYLVAMLLITRRAASEDRTGWFTSLLIISAAMLGIGYGYHIGLGMDSTAFDIGLYVVLMAVGFWLPLRLSRLCSRTLWGKAARFLVAALGLMLLLFTFLPPDHILFADLSTVHTWYTIPC